MNPTDLPSNLPAQLIGIFFVITSFSMAFRRKMMMGVFNEIFRTRALSYIFGLLTLGVGLFLILKRQVWSGATSEVINILGWYLSIESLAYLFLPQRIMARFFGWLEYKKVYYTISIVFLILGGYLIYAGFLMSF
jgi:hypothetical protein